MTLKAKWEANFLALEFLAALILAVILFAWSEFFGGNQFLNAIFSQRSAFYSTLASLFGTMLGFTITAAAIVLGYSTHEKLAIVRQSKHYSDLWNVFKSAMRFLALATLFSLLGFIFDKDAKPINLGS
jgi:hypothetical protein